MKKAPLYSRSRALARAADANAAALEAAAPVATRGSRFHAALLRHERRLWAGAVLLLLATGLVLNTTRAPRVAPLTIEQIDAAIRQSIDDKPLPSPVTRAYETILRRWCGWSA